MNIIDRYVFGSSNSLDTDVVYIVDELPETIAECKKFQVANENVNLATIKDGVIDRCFKGTPDELNNAIFSTYHLHEQDCELRIERMVERDVPLKCIRAVRSILSHLSRSPYRKEVKEALRGSWGRRIEVLKQIALGEENIDFDSLNNNMSGRDILKLIAFQIGQTSALLFGEECYTKDDVGNMYHELIPFLRRESDDWEILKNILSFFCTRLTLMFDYYDLEDNKVKLVRRYISSGDGGTYDLQTEKRV